MHRAADDLVSILSYIIVQAQCPRLVIEHQYLLEFVDSTAALGIPNGYAHVMGLSLVGECCYSLAPGNVVETENMSFFAQVTMVTCSPHSKSVFRIFLG